MGICKGFKSKVKDLFIEVKEKGKKRLGYRIIKFYFFYGSRF